MDDSGPSTAASTNATKQGRDVKDSDKKEDSSPTKQMTQRLASGMHTMADKSKGALHSAAHTVGALSKKAATSAANTVKHGTHLAALPFKDTLKDTRESEPQDKSVTLEPTVLNTPTLIPTLTDEVSARPVDANQHNLLSSMLHPRSSMSFQDSGYVDDDRMILWIVVASVAFLQTIQNLGIIFYENVVPFSVVLAWMLVAFTAGMEVDATILVQEIKYRVLGPNLVKLERSSSIEPMESTTNMSTAQSARIARRRNPIRIFQKMMSSPTNKPHTCLARSLNRQDRRKRNMRFDSLFVHRLSHFGRNKSKDETTISLETTTTTAEEESDGLGRVDLDDAQATVLLSKMQVEPLCQLRGIDIFLTECAESEMSTHPFLRR